MTREEKQKAIDALKISTPIKAMTQEEFNDYIQTLNKVMDWLEQEPCEDAISRKAVLDRATSYYTDGWDTTPLVVDVEDIEELPSVIPQPKTGHWKDCGEREPWYRCSKCGEKTWGSSYKYCPHCGARMIKP